MKIVTRRWRVPKVIWVLLVTELPFTIAALAIFSIADPDLYRTALWKDGAANGFNSDPRQVLYAYVNHTPIIIPLVWSQFITSFNVVIAILSTFILVTKTMLFILHLFLPLLSTIIHALLAALFAYSVYAQSSPDTSDPAHPQPGAPWYLTKSCSVASNPNNVGYCRQAKTAFALSCILLGLFSTNLFVAIWSLFQRTADRAADARDGKGKGKGKGKEPLRKSKSGVRPEAEQPLWELQPYPRTEAGMPPEEEPLNLSETTPDMMAWAAIGQREVV